MITPHQIKLVQVSFQKVKPIADTAADIFYDRLFETTPEVRSLFPAEMSDQKGKLMKTIGVAVSGLDKLDTIVPTVKALGAKHVNYGVKDSHYSSVGEALLFTLEKGLGDEWNPELNEAWTAAYTIVSTTMIAGADEARSSVAVSKPASADTVSSGAVSSFTQKLADGFFSRIFGRA